MSRASQSALQPAAGSAAELVDQLGTIMYVGASVILVLVVVLVVYGVVAKATTISTRRWIVVGGFIFPAVTLTALLVYSLVIGNAVSAIGTSNALRASHEHDGDDRVSSRISRDDRLRIHIVGKQWWWEVRYELPGGSEHIMLANEVHVPIDRPVELVLSTTDVIHSLWVPALAGKIDMIPGRTTHLRVQTSERGRFRGQCAEYCGGQHALMAFVVVTQTAEDFAAWLSRQVQPVSAPSDEFLRIGYDAFFKGNCHSCHAIRGTRATATRGPDLTHVGGRESLAAGVLNNHIGTMAGWIAGAQDIKPGNAMPSNPLFTGVELRALAAWLGSLE
jgi:cytochrome c oxidase subunit 2